MARVNAWSRPVRRISAVAATTAGVSAMLAIINVATMRRLRPPRADTPHEVVVCIPARNEKDRLPALLTDLRAQTHCPNLRVVVLDDGSTDGTFAAAQAAVTNDGRFEVVRTESEPPTGWTGKAAACHTLTKLAFDRRPVDHRAVDYIAFVDADVRLATGAVASAVAALRVSGASLVCPWPRQLSGTVAEALVQPLLSFSWMSTLPVRIADASTRPSTGVACGQFMMFDANAYRSIGGHASVAASLTEDLDIARTLRGRGKRTVLVAGGEFVRCRMYDGWSAVRDGYTRWLWDAFGGRAGSTMVLATMALAYLVPPAAAVFGSGATRRWGLFGYLAAVASRMASARMESGPQWSLPRTVAASTAHPVSVLIYGGLTVESFRRRRRGSSMWKGRSLPDNT